MTVVPARSRTGGRVALTVAGSGAVSLGAFEAGAVAALVTGLQTLCAGDDPDVRVDVVTGASSGAITGLLAAHCLAHGTDAVATLHEAWVERASLAELQGRGWRAPLSLDRLRQTAVTLMAEGRRGDLARRQDGPVRLELALASLRGWGAEGTDRPLDRMAESRYLTWSSFEVTPGMEPRDLSNAVESALASAANPALFPPRLVRPGPLGTPAGALGDDDGPLGPPGYYSDGGLLTDEPIARAHELARRDAGHRWLLLLVHPYQTRRAAGPGWANPEVPPTWAATIRRGLQIRRAELLARDLRRVRAAAAEGAPVAVAVVSPDTLDDGRGGAARGLPGSSSLGGLGGFLSRDRRQREFDLGYRCGLRWLESAALATELGVDDAAVTAARSAAQAGYEIVRGHGTPRPSTTVRDVLRVVHAGGRLAAVAVHDAVLAREHAQEVVPRRGRPVSPAAVRRSTRWIHRRGMVFEGAFVLETVVPSVLAAHADNAPDTFAVGTPPPGEVAFPALVRFSRFAPRGPGSRFVGMAVKVRDPERGDQDLLLLSSLATMLGRRLFWPAGTPLGNTFYSSVLSYRVAGERLLIGARVEGDPPAMTLDELLAQDPLQLTFRLEVARPRGLWFSLGRLSLGRRRPDLDVRFRPTNTWPRVSPCSLGRLRDRVYVASQEGRPPPGWLRPLGVGDG